MISFLRRNWKIVTPIGVVGTVFLVWLVFFYLGLQYLIIDDKVDEAGPVFASGAGMMVTEIDEVSGEEMVEPAEPEMEILTLLSGSFIDRSHPAEGTAAVLTDGTEQRFLRFEDFATDNGPDLNVYLSSAAPDAPAGEFDDDFVDLGDLKGNIGSQNYEIPADVDLSRYRSVVIWCVRFSVAFGAAELA